MWRLNRDKILPKVIKLATYVIVFWVVFLLGRSVWQNWVFKKNIWQLNEQIVILNKQKKDLENLLVYYSSDSFRELEARKRLGLKKAGEKIFLIATTASPGPSLQFPEEVTKEKESVAGVTQASKISNWLLWWQYFTK